MTLDAYHHGGVNLTGFQLVDFTNVSHNSFFERWEGLDPISWPGAGTSKISVRKSNNGSEC